jgi:hypothetical protein
MVIGLVARACQRLFPVRAGAACLPVSRCTPRFKKPAIYMLKPCSAIVVAALIYSCAPVSAPIVQTDPAQTPFLPTATIQDLMDGMIDPAADFIWDSVGTVITAAGTEERRPRSDAGWKELRRRAVTLVEATNLLVIPGRHVSNEAFASAGPGVLSSDEIERKLTEERPGFNSFALSLREIALKELAAIDHRDVAALSDAGEVMDGVCEACHVAHWYPHEVIPPLPDFK